MRAEVPTDEISGCDSFEMYVSDSFDDDDDVSMTLDNDSLNGFSDEYELCNKDIEEHCRDNEITIT